MLSLPQEGRWPEAAERKKKTEAGLYSCTVSRRLYPRGAVREGVIKNLGIKTGLWEKDLPSA